MKLFIDDIRDAPKGWILATTISEAVNIIRRYALEITHISFDHDISIPISINGVHRACPSPDTFKVVCYFVVDKILDECYGIREDVILTTHSANPDGRKEIVAIFDDIGIVCTETPYQVAHRDASERPKIEF